MSKKLLIVTLVILTALLGLFYFYNASTTINNKNTGGNGTNNWHRYDSNGLAYTFQYPAGWSIEHSYGSGGLVLQFRNNQENIMNLSYASRLQGVTVCGSNPDACQIVNSDIGEFEVYWDDQPTASLRDRDNYLTLTLLRSNQATDEIFLKIIKSFENK